MKKNTFTEIFQTKPLDDLLHASKQKSNGGLKRFLGPYNLIFFGIGAIIGAGIFVLTGSAAANYAGPAIVLSFILAGIASLFSAFCYAEFASLIPISGSAYTYGYATLGEFFAWLIGWDLILEYSLSVATVASGWSGYFLSLLNSLNIHLPPALSAAPGMILVKYQGHWHHLERIKVTLESNMTLDQIALLPHMTASFNLTAFLIVLLITCILILGIKISADFNSWMVIIKLLILLVFIVVVGHFVFLHPEETLYKNWKEFIPPNLGEYGKFGWSGVFRAAGVIFFAFIGFDAVSTTAQEAKNPQKDMPVGIIGSLVVCTFLYVVVSGLLTLIVPYTSLNVSDPVALGIEMTGAQWGGILIDIGAIFGLGTVMLVMLFGQSRIFYSMSQDGLLPNWVGKIHPKFHTPYISTIVTGLLVAFCSALLPINVLGELVSIGTLLTFIIVALGILILRKRYPNLHRPFKTPGMPYVPLMAVIVSLSLMLSLPYETWLRFIIWFAIGIIIYFSYSRHHSKLRNKY
jgi:APA family basic amino acid/polyamine antiporter